MKDEGYLYICVGIWRTENQRLQHCGQGSVSDGKRECMWIQNWWVPEAQETDGRSLVTCPYIVLKLEVSVTNLWYSNKKGKR